MTGNEPKWRKSSRGNPKSKAQGRREKPGSAIHICVWLWAEDLMTSPSLCLSLPVCKMGGWCALAAVVGMQGDSACPVLTAGRHRQGWVRGCPLPLSSQGRCVRDGFMDIAVWGLFSFLCHDANFCSQTLLSQSNKTWSNWLKWSIQEISKGTRRQQAFLPRHPLLCHYSSSSRYSGNLILDSQCPRGCAVLPLFFRLNLPGNPVIEV